jgi:Pin2-interacting protein X1
MASKSTTAMSEILGIAPIPSSTASGSITPSDKPSPQGDGLALETLTTSTKSVADYFRDKLLARSSAKSGTATSATPRTEYDAEAHDAPRGGLGSSRSNPDMPKLFSPIPFFSAPTNQSSPREPASDILSVETPTPEDISLTNPSPSTKKKRGKDKNPFVRPDTLSEGKTSEGQTRAKSDKNIRKEKKRSQESC